VDIYPVVHLVRQRARAEEGCLADSWSLPLVFVYLFRYTHPSVAARKKPKLACRFYQTATGNEPVRDWLRDLPAAARKEIGADIGRVQWSWPIGKPLVDGFGAGLFEVRSALDGNIFRILFCLDGSTMVLLHGFQKKSQKTPKADLELARRRMKDAEDGT